MPDYNISSDKEIAAAARALILSDLRVYDTVAVLAVKLNTSPYTLRRVFKKYYGQRITQFSLQVRIHEAKRLLAVTNYTLQTIAECFGYTEGNNCSGL